MDEAPPPTVEDSSQFADDLQERDYLAASELFQHPPRVQEKSRLLLTTLAVFVLASVARGGSSITELALLVGVLFIHELGHALGMIVFGYADVRIFFIPLFGAAAAGRKRGVARWKEGVVLLMGPLPGLVVGTVLLVGGASDLMRTVALQLVAINGFNLLPLTPLDGGQLFQLLLFSRHRHLEVAFQTIASLALLGGGLYFRLWVLAMVGGFMVAVLPIRKRVLAAGAALRAQELPADPIALDDAQRRTVFAAVWALMPVQWRGKPRPQAATMEQLLDTATRRPTGLAASLALFVGWAAGLAVAVVAAIAFVAGEPANWQRYEDQQHQCSIELPAAPAETAMTTPGSGMLRAHLGRRGEYVVIWTPVGPGVDWRSGMRAALGAQGATPVRKVPMPDGDPAEILDLKGQPTWTLLRGEGAMAFAVLATGDDVTCERVIRSFRILHPR
ncbi:MAG: site-2 protease family protein [Deltaproteobacteria bacterium]|nr:site-2 protease family protein [Deltaproteobacteria bacterium]